MRADGIEDLSCSSLNVFEALAEELRGAAVQTDDDLASGHRCRSVRSSWTKSFDDTGMDISPCKSETLNLYLISSIYKSSYMKRRLSTRFGSGSDTNGAHLWLLLWKATKAVEAHAHGSVRATGLCLSDFGVLEALLHKGALPVSTLGRQILLTSGSITVAVDRLERRGLVERKFTKLDRRARIVRLTRSGAKLIRKVFAEHAQDMEYVFSCLNNAERDGLAGLLRKLGHAADNHPPGGNDTTQKERRKGRS